MPIIVAILVVIVVVIAADALGGVGDGFSKNEDVQDARLDKTSNELAVVIVIFLIVLGLAMSGGLASTWALVGAN